MPNFSEYDDGISVPPPPNSWGVQSPDAQDRNPQPFVDVPPGGLRNPIQQDAYIKSRGINGYRNPSEEVQQYGQMNDSTPPSFQGDNETRVAKAKFLEFVSRQATDTEGMKAASDFWKPLGDTLNNVKNNPLFQKIGEGVNASSDVTESSLGTLQAADLERRREQILHPQAPTSGNIPDWLPTSQRGQHPESITQKAIAQQNEAKRLNDFEAGAGGIANQTGLPVNDWRVIMNSGKYMREQNPSAPDQVASGLLDPINLPLSVVGGGPAAKALAKGAGDAKTAVVDSFRAAPKSPESGMTRLFRGEGPRNADNPGMIDNSHFWPDEKAAAEAKANRGRWFSDNKDFADNYSLLKDEGGGLYYKDVPNETAKASDITPPYAREITKDGQTVADNSREFILPPEDAASMKKYQGGAMNRFLKEEGGSIQAGNALGGLNKFLPAEGEHGKVPGGPTPERQAMSEILDKLQKSTNPRDVATAKQIRGMMLQGAKDPEILKALESGGLDTSGIVADIPSQEKKIQAVVDQMSKTGSQGAKVAGTDVVSGSGKKITSAATPEEAQKIADDINSRLASAPKASNVKSAKGGIAKVISDSLPQDTKLTIAKILEQHTGQTVDPNSVEGIVKDIINANETTRNQIPFEQTAAFNPDEFKGKFTLPGDNFPEPTNPAQKPNFVQENIPPDPWSGGTVEPKTGAQWKQEKLDIAGKNIQNDATGTWDERPNGLFGDQPAQPSLQEGMPWQDGQVEPQTAAEWRQARRDRAGQNITADATGSFGDASSFQNVSPTGDVQQAMLDSGFGKQPPGGFIDKVGNFANNFDRVINTPRQLKAMGDLSALLNQGAIPFWAHNPEWRKFADSSVRSLTSEAGYKDVMAETKAIKTYELGQRFGLANKFEGDMVPGGVKATYEAFDRGLAREIPLLGKLAERSDKAYEAGLANLRTNIFDTYAQAWDLEKRLSNFADPKGIAKAERTGKALADFVNSISGHGHLGVLEKAAPGLNEIFFAPRFFASRINNIFSPLVYTGSAALGKTDWKLAGLAWRDMGMYYGGVALTLKMAEASGAKVEWDPRSVRFGSIQVGDHYIDVTGGMSRTMAAMNEIFLAHQTLTGSGRVTNTINPEFGDKNGWQVAADWFRTKANVPVSEFIDTTMTGNKNVAGEDMGIGGHIPIPIGIKSVMEAAVYDYNQAGGGTSANAIIAGARGAGTALPSLLGLGVNTYHLKRGSGAQRIGL